MKTLTIVGAALLLAACATPAERAAQRQRDIDAMMAEYGPACERLGYKAHTDAWRDCILRLSTKDAYERARAYPWTSTCFGSPGFYQCSMF
ncbi:MAG TPA: hypothetical protein VF816_16465 [Rhodocyclaceae bacterium]